MSRERQSESKSAREKKVRESNEGEAKGNASSILMCEIKA